MSTRVYLKKGAKGGFAQGTRESYMRAQAVRRQQSRRDLAAAIAWTPSPAALSRIPYGSVSAGQRGAAASGKQEVKSFDTLVTPDAAGLPIFSGPPAFAEPGVAFAGYTCINEIQAGNAFYNRIGSKIVVKSIALHATLNALATTPQVCVRVALIYDRQPNGAAPAFTDMFAMYPGAVNAFAGGINIQNKNRFLILRDQFFTLDTAQSLVKQICIYAKGRWEVSFGPSAGNIGDIFTGSLLLVAYHGTAVGVGAISMKDINTRVRYFD